MALKKLSIKNPQELKSLFIDTASDYEEIDFIIISHIEDLGFASKKDYYIPDKLVLLKNLKKLDANNNCHLPANIDQLQPLEELYVSEEAIYNVPDSIKNIKFIRDLRIVFDPKNNEPQISPEWIFDVKNVEKLTMAYCRFSEIKINNKNANQLEEVDLSCSLSDLKMFPNLSSLKDVKKLSLSAETVMGQKMPPYELFGQMLENIKDLEQIEGLDISFWKPKKKSDGLVIKDGKISIPDVFDRFPNLVRLSIANMKIDFIPDSILGQKKLRDLQIQGNNFEKNEIARIKTSLPKCGIQNY